jgi:hypothetical protein
MPSFANVELADTVGTWRTLYNAIAQHLTITTGIGSSNTVSANTLVANAIIIRAGGGQYSGSHDFSNGTMTLPINTVGNTHLVQGAVGSYEIANDAVSNTHIQQGAVGSYELANDSVTASHIEIDSIANTHLQQGSVGSYELANGSVTFSHMEVDSIANTILQQGAVGSYELANNAVSNTHLQQSAVGAYELANGAVSNTHYQHFSISAVHVVAGSLTLDKLADNAKAYDIPFFAGWGADGSAEDLAVQQYGGLIILPRPITFESCIGFANTVPTGAAVIVDIEKNGTTIFSSKPTMGIGANSTSNGTISVSTADAGDMLAFKITQIGSTLAGARLSFSLKARET